MDKLNARAELIPVASREKNVVGSSGCWLSQLEEPQKSGIANTSASLSLNAMLDRP